MEEPSFKRSEGSGVFNSVRDWLKVSGKWAVCGGLKINVMRWTTKVSRRRKCWTEIDKREFELCSDK